jgi:hypothetical protein
MNTLVRTLREAEARPCPFCGCGDAKLWRDGKSWLVSCHECEIDGPAGESELEAILRWNGPVPRKIGIACMTCGR